MKYNPNIHYKAMRNGSDIGTIIIFLIFCCIFTVFALSKHSYRESCKQTCAPNDSMSKVSVYSHSSCYCKIDGKWQIEKVQND